MIYQLETFINGERQSKAFYRTRLGAETAAEHLLEGFYHRHLLHASRISGVIRGNGRHQLRQYAAAMASCNYQSKVTPFFLTEASQ